MKIANMGSLPDLSKKIQMRIPFSETVVVLGASPDPSRYSYAAVSRLSAVGFDVVAIGRRQGTIGRVRIVTVLPPGLSAHTVSVYLRPELQDVYEEWLLSGAVGRVVFNPGTENAGLKQRLEAAGVDVVLMCTLVMISAGEF